MKYLFIGGSHDGEWYEVHERRQQLQLCSLPDHICYATENINDPYNVSYEIYNLHSININTKEFFIYAISTMNNVEVIFTLINNYKKKGTK